MERWRRAMEESSEDQRRRRVTEESDGEQRAKSGEQIGRWHGMNGVAAWH